MLCALFTSRCLCITRIVYVEVLVHHAHCLRRDACASRALFTSRCLCITRIVYVEVLVHHAHCLRRGACASRALFTSRCLCITRIVYVEVLVHHAHCLRRGACASRALHERSNCLHRSIGRCADMKARGSTAGPLSETHCRTVS